MRKNREKGINGANQEIKWVYSLSPMQSGMLYHTILEKSAVYCEQWEFSIRGSLEKSLLEESFNCLVDRYDILRTVFIYEDLQEPVQVVLQERKTVIHFEDIGHLGEREQDLHVEAFKRQDKEKGFDLGKDQLMNLVLFKRGDNAFTLVFSYHHILMDGWSLGLIFGELLRFYLALRMGKPLQLEPAVPYRDYIQWLKQQDKESGLSYWRHYLEGFQHRTGVPKSRESGGTGGYQVEEFGFLLDEGLSRGLRQLAAENRVTVNILFQTLWGIVLQKYNDTDDVVYGAVVSGRPPEIDGIEQMVGLFINTVPLRVKTRENQSFLKLLEQVHHDGVLSKPYEYLPLAEIQAQSSLKMELLDHILVFENLPVQKEVSDTGIDRNIDVYYQVKDSSRQTNYDFNILIEPLDRFSINLSYNSLVYDSEFIERAAGHFTRAAGQVLSSPGLEIKQVELVGEEEKRLILDRFNDTEAVFPREKTILELFAEQAVRTPHRAAVVGKSVSVSYHELDRRSRRLARILKQKGVTPSTIVGIMVHRSIEMVVGIWAILEAGGAYLPIDPGYPGERVRYILGDSAAKLILTPKPFGKDLEDICQPLDPADPALYRTVTGEGDLEKNHTAADPAYVLYTSGSTGRPKGVVVQHGSVVNIISALDEAYPFDKDDVYMLKTSYLFDVSVTEFFGWFMGGGRLAVLEREGEKDPRKIIETIRDLQVTHLNFVPSMFQAFVDYIAAVNENLDWLSSLKYIFLAGEALPPEPVLQFRAFQTAARLENIYGPTEATIYAANYPLRQWDGVSAIPIGKPLPNVMLHILDRRGHLQPVGVPGELCIAGVGVARGYLNQPQLTAEKFVDYRSYRSYRSYRLHFSKILYRTGDLSRWLPDGNIEFFGRLDHQIKIRGFRIDPGEIESQLLKLDEVGEALVIAKEEGSQGKQGERYLVGYIVLNPSSGALPTPAEPANTLVVSRMQDHLAKHLPAYMIPAHFIILDNIPLTLNGKVDRKALPEPVVTAGEQYTAPRDEIERKLVKIWAGVLRIDESVIGIDSDFFDLGGHSVKIIMAVAGIHKELEVKIPISQVFKRPTVRKLSQLIKEAEKAAYISVKSAEKKEYYPLSSAQQGIYILQQLMLDNTSYNMPDIRVVEGPIAREKLETAVRKLIHRHESLRTSFLPLDSGVVQRIQEADDVRFRMEYYKADGQGSLEETEIIRQFVRPFDLSQAPLLRAGLIKLQETRHILMLDMHHITADGVSQGIVFRELAELYQGNALRPARIHYKDFSLWQSCWLAGEMREKQESYWLEVFRARPALSNLPLDYPRPSLQRYEADSFFFEADTRLTEKINELESATQTTFFMILLAVYYILLSKYTLQEDIVVGAPINGRNHADTQTMIGMFANILPLRNQPREHLSFAEFLGDVKKSVLEAFENQDYRYDDLLKKLGLHGGWRSLFNVAFTADDMEAGESANNKKNDTGGLKLYPYPYQKITAKYDLAILAFKQGGVIRMNMQYDTELFKQETIQRISTYYVEILQDVAENRDKQLKDIEFPHQPLAVESHKLLKDLDEFEF